MNPEKMDRRVRTTRRLLRQGLFQLLSEKRLRDITVKELCERADVNRGTFYLHYHDVYDLFSQIEEEIYHEIEASLQRHEPGDFGDHKKVFPIFAEIFDYLVKNYQICVVLLGENRDQAFFDRLTNIGRTDSVSTWTKAYQIDRRMAEYYYSYAVSGCIGILRDWLDSGRHETAQELALLSERFTRKGLETLRQPEKQVF